MTRTGAEYVESLRDGREVWIDGERVADVTTHPAFRNTVRSIAGLYDMTHDERWRETLTYPSPATGEPVSRGYQIPYSHEDLVARRKAMKTWSEATFGFMGRSPDYMASGWAGFASVPSVFARGGQERAEHLMAYYAHLRDDDLYQSHTIVNPQVDRSRDASRQEEPLLYVGVRDERDDGIVVRGAKMVGTAALFGDEIFVGTIEPLGRDDSDYALTFSIPFNTKGVKVISRASYEQSARSPWDNPLSSHLDENDALMIYDDVLVPWERLFVYRDVELAYLQWWDTPSFVHWIHQGATRFWTKLEFLAGLAIKIARSNNVEQVPLVRMQLGRILTSVNMAKAAVMGMEANWEHVPDGGGSVMPNRAIAFAQRAWAPRAYVEVLDEIKVLCGGSLIQMPSSYKDLVHPEEGPLLERYVRSPGHDAQQRIKLYKLAWDALGSEFASRHEHYERFYHGAPYVAQPAAYREGAPEVCEAIADAALGSYSLGDALAAADEAMAALAPVSLDGVVRRGAAEGAGVVPHATELEAARLDRRLPMWRR